ncbi:MAG: GAF domain-containing protein [Betaproteobacteria bacterium]|nr:MAG: GAF domain-containing protein [Betaproteobacteria bacterium]
MFKEPRRPGPGSKSGLGRLMREKRTVHIPDLLQDAASAEGDPMRLQTLRGGVRTWLGVPLLKEGELIGAILVYRSEPRAFGEQQISLLETFADQAVIAIENVRLFKELQARTEALTRSVGQLTALGEVGQAISSTLDLETVLKTIVSRAVQLTGLDSGSIYEYDDRAEEFRLQAAENMPQDVAEDIRKAPTRKGDGALGRTAITLEPTQVPDTLDDSYRSARKELLIRAGYRALLAVPLLREDHLLGGLLVNRKTPGAFAPEIVELLKTFAAQSALAIQNARLFREIEEKGGQLEAASRHKSEFLANMSHELRTPLNAIIGFSEVLSERMFGEINDKQAEYLGDILESGRHLLSLINDILDLSKIEAGRMELDPTDFDLPTAIENTLILVRERAHRRGIALEHTVDERLGMIRADERKLKQVLLNLLSNALKFTPEGGQIDVRARVENGEAEISVADTGEGIAPEDQEAVFEEFRQVGKAAKKVEGTGLGLAISRKFIELHGGRIWVKSQLGIGSTFAFTLPLTIDSH